MDLFQYVLTSTYFEQTKGVAMGSPLLSVIADFFTEGFEKQALESTPLKPSLYKRYIDDTLLVWPHGLD